MQTKEAHLYQGRLHSVKGEHEEAIEEYKKALKLEPDYKPAKVNLGFISYMKGPLNKDRVTSNKYMKLRPKGVLRSEASPKGDEVNVPRPEKRENLR